MKLNLLSMLSLLTCLNLFSGESTFRNICPDVINSQVNCTITLSNDTECTNDATCATSEQLCCNNKCKNVCTDPVYYKALCPEDNILTNPNEWTKFCLGDCNCPQNMACCPGPCATRVCRTSINYKADCPSPETYNCGFPKSDVTICGSHRDCIHDDQLCCPDACNNKYCQIPEYHSAANYTENTEQISHATPRTRPIPFVQTNPAPGPNQFSQTTQTIELTETTSTPQLFRYIKTTAGSQKIPFDETASTTEAKRDPSTNVVTPKETVASSSCDPLGTCFDLAMTLEGESMEKFFPLYTIFIDNTVEKCAAFCQIYGYSKIAISTEIGCFCFKGSLDKLNCKSEDLCSFPCPGDGKGRCGGIFPNYVNIYNTNILSLEAAKSKFPSGLCFEAKLDKDEQMTADDFPQIPKLTPSFCKQECGHRGYSWSCTYLGRTCGCYKPGNEPVDLSPFQEYCIAPCTGDMKGVSKGITCGGESPPALAVVNCLPTGVQN